MREIPHKRLVVCLIILFVSSIFAIFGYKVLLPVLKNIQLEHYVQNNMREIYESNQLYYGDTGPLTQITGQVADNKSFGTIFINPDKMNKITEYSKSIKNIKVIKNKDKRAFITLRDSKTNKLLGVYNMVTADSSIDDTFGEQEDQMSILEENYKLDIGKIIVKGEHGFTDAKEYLVLSEVDKITYSKLDLDSDSPEYKEYSFTLGDLPEIKELINEYNSKYSKNKLSLEYLNKNIIRVQMKADTGSSIGGLGCTILVVFFIIFAFTILSILYLPKMKA